MPAEHTLAARVLAGDARAVARAISLVENEAPESAELIRAIFHRTGRAYLVGLTGPPGAGKSTIADRLTTEIRRGGQTVGVIAVDPSSPFTGGALLGDRVRMGAHADDAGVFIRSMATRGHLGGLARSTAEAALVLDAAGSDVILIETVGVGQDEIEIVGMADVSVVAMVPGTGDDVQAQKAGLMEIADIFVVNKADREGADNLVHAIASSLTLRTVAREEWRPPILKTVATDAVGIGELWTSIQDFRRHSAADREEKRRGRERQRVRSLLSQRLLERVAAMVPAVDFNALLEEIVARRLDPYTAVAGLVDRVLGPDAGNGDSSKLSRGTRPSS